MVLSRNWGICGIGSLAVTSEGEGGDVSDYLSSFNNYSKIRKISKIAQKNLYYRINGCIPTKVDKATKSKK
jgi:hypothetical protein